MRSPSVLLFPAFFASLSRAAATSFISSPYVKCRLERECTTAVDWGSCFLIASKMGKRGSVDAILWNAIIGAIVKGLEEATRVRRASGRENVAARCNNMASWRGSNRPPKRGSFTGTVPWRYTLPIRTAVVLRVAQLPCAAVGLPIAIALGWIGQFVEVVLSKRELRGL